jgi:IS30 family transposase
MEYPNDNTNPRKQKHLSFEERVTIQLRLKDGNTPYSIAKELGRSINTITNEIRRGTVSQIIQNKKIMLYLADAGEAVYKKHRKNCCPKFKRLSCNRFICYVCKHMKDEDWSVDACYGRALESGSYKRQDMVCTKTLYNYIDLGLLEIRNTDLPMKLRINTKTHRVRSNKRKLGTSIEDRPEDILTRKEFGHWEIDTVIGKKTKDDCILLTIAERQTRNFLIRKIASKTTDAVMNELINLRNEFGDRFDRVFKTITSDNGLEFAELCKLENQTDTKVYFTHPYASCEKGTNERHNGLIRRFIPKGTAINDYSAGEICIIEEWCNTLPRKILGYHTPEELFEAQLDIIYAA